MRRFRPAVPTTRDKARCEYTLRFGAGRVARSDVLDITPGNPAATIIADLADARNIESNSCDCLILTQVFVLIRRVQDALRETHRILKPGGVALITVPGISHISPLANEAAVWSWSFYPETLRALLADAGFAASGVAIESFGNLRTTVAFLAGLAREDLDVSDYVLNDPQFPLIVAARAEKEIAAAAVTAVSAAPVPRVSVITIFLNEERFLGEAIESVLAQRYENWELLLVDDGSTDGSSEIARAYARRWPSRIRYLEHEGHANLGITASRNLALKNARGEYLAFVDGDDVWMPEKLERQVPVLDQSPELGMLYCATLYWYSWPGSPEGATPDALYQPAPSEVQFSSPDLLPRFLREEVLMPCHGSILVRRRAVEDVGGWESSFRGLYEDQVLFAKLCLATDIHISADCHDRYRQHEDSCCAIAYRNGDDLRVRREFHAWLRDYLAEKGLEGSESWIALQDAAAKLAGS